PWTRRRKKRLLDQLPIRRLAPLEELNVATSRCHKTRTALHAQSDASRASTVVLHDDSNILIVHDSKIAAQTGHHIIGGLTCSRCQRKILCVHRVATTIVEFNPSGSIAGPHLTDGEAANAIRSTCATSVFTATSPSAAIVTVSAAVLTAAAASARASGPAAANSCTTT